MNNWGVEEGFNTIMWQGETFALRRRYASWETYKKGQHQLAKREIARVRQKMTAITVPAHFKNHSALAHGLVDLRFPGYGCSCNGQVRDAAGGCYQLEEFDVPETGEVRALLYRKNDDLSFTLVLDQVCPEINPEKQFLVLTQGQWRVEDGYLRIYLHEACLQETPLMVCD